MVCHKGAPVCCDKRVNNMFYFCKGCRINRDNMFQFIARHCAINDGIRKDIAKRGNCRAALCI